MINEEQIKRIIKEVISEYAISEDGEDFGVNVKGDLTIDDIMQGEKVYHRPKDSPGDNPLAVINSLMKNGFSREYTGSNGGNMYGPGVYNVYSLRSSNDRATGYGRFIVMSYVLGGYKDFLIFNTDMARKIYGNDWPIIKQIKMLMPEKLAQKVLSSVDNLGRCQVCNGSGVDATGRVCRRCLGTRTGCMNNDRTSYDIKTSITAKKIVDVLGRDIAKTKIRGIIYSGGHDGNCCFVRNFSDVVPYSYSTDNGKTWKVAITDELIWRAGHNTDVDAIIKDRVDDNGKKMFSDTAERSINGFVRVYKGDKMNYFEVATNRLISDVWFDFGEEFEDDDTTKVVYNGVKYILLKNDEGKFVIYDEDECPVCYLENLPESV